MEALYVAFAGYERPKTFLGCGCGVCFEGRVVEPSGWADTMRPIVEVPSPGGDLPLRAIEADDLVELATSITLTGGNPQLLKHYVPRLLELSGTGGFDWPDPFVVWGHLTHRVDDFVPWWEWPKAEQEAISGYYAAVWRERCALEPRDASDILDGLIHGVPDMTQYLAIWAAAPTDRIHKIETFQWVERPRDSAFTDGHELTNWEAVERWLRALP